MNLSIDQSDLRPIVQAVVAEVLASVGVADAAFSNRLAYPESEAASLLGVKAHVLRDARLRGEITATKCGGRLAYEVSELRAYLTRNRIAT